MWFDYVVRKLRHCYDYCNDYRSVPDMLKEGVKIKYVAQYSAYSN